MAKTPAYTVPEFVRDAKEILALSDPLEQKKRAIAEQMKLLAKRDDLTSNAAITGPSDASTNGYLLWREPRIILLLVQLDQYYRSPVHHHGDFWVVGCGYRGRDRWDIYERRDDGTKPGYADLELVDHVVFTPGIAGWMPAPPRAIHSHNNEFDGNTLELVFSGTAPLPPGERLIYNVEAKTCRPTIPQDQMRALPFWPPDLATTPDAAR